MLYQIFFNDFPKIRNLPKIFLSSLDIERTLCVLQAAMKYTKQRNRTYIVGEVPTAGVRSRSSHTQWYAVRLYVVIVVGDTVVLHWYEEL